MNPSFEVSVYVCLVKCVLSNNTPTTYIYPDSSYNPLYMPSACIVNAYSTVVRNSATITMYGVLHSRN